MNRRHKSFIRHYLDKTNKKTYKNGTQSAIEAGFSVKSAHVIAHRLLRNDKISQKIKEYEQEEAKQFAKSKEDAILEARQNYEEAQRNGDKTMIKYWHDMWINLKGWMVQKVESKVEVGEAQQETIADQVRRYAQDNRN